MRESKADFGKELAELRTGKGVSLEDLASAIKVRVGLLKALEEGRFEALPPPVFVEGYLKAYAHHLGVEAAPLLARYRGFSLAAAPPPKVQVPVAQLQDDEGQGSGWLKWILLVAVLAAAGYGAYYLAGRMGDTGQAEAPARSAALARAARKHAAPSQAPGEVSENPQASPSAQAPSGVEPIPPQPAAGVETGPSASATAEPAAPAPALPEPEPPKSTAAAPLPAETVPAAPAGDLVLKASGACWCEVWADGKRVLYRMVTAGEHLGFSGSAFKASVGNAGAVELIYKGQRVPLPHEQGVVVKDLAIPSPSGGPAP